MKSTSNKIPLGQIEKGEELKEIEEEAIDDEVVHKTGDETIDGNKKFKKNPTSDKPATTGKGLVRKEEFDAEIDSKAEDDSVVHKTGNKTESIDGKKTFESAPK